MPGHGAPPISGILRSAISPSLPKATGPATSKASVANFRQITLASDNVFSDGATLESPLFAGSSASGYSMSMDVGISA